MSFIETLKQSELFKDLQDHELSVVAAMLVELQLPTDAVLLTQHEPAPAVFILKSGAVKVMVNGEIVAQISTVQCFGEMSCVVPDTVATAAVDRAPHRISTWVRELAGAVHGFYHDCYVMGEGISPELTQARLHLVEAASVGLAIGLDLLGVSAPDQM